MRDLQNTTSMWAKGWLFLFMGISSAALLLAETPTLKTALLLALVIWSFCRAYYFAFYVIEKYVDGQYKFSGLGSFCMYLFRNRKGK